MKKTRIVFLLLGACSLVASCGPVPRPHGAFGKPAALAQLAQTRWTAAEIDGVGVGGKHHPILVFISRAEVAGVGGCNRFQGAAETKDGKVQIGPLAVTSMSCSPERNELEQRFLAALQKPVKVQRNFEQLYFVGEVAIRFRRSFESLDTP